MADQEKATQGDDYKPSFILSLHSFSLSTCDHEAEQVYVRTHPGRHHDPKPGALRVPELCISSWPSATHLPTSSRVSSYHWPTPSKKRFLNFPSVPSHGEGKEPISSRSTKPGPAVQTQREHSKQTVSSAALPRHTQHPPNPN